MHSSCKASTPGTSPRTRGKLWGGFCVWFLGGNIPAHAGKTYPRRGDHQVNTGTSPRTRGKRRTFVTEESFTGNIPAHAGKTFEFIPVFHCVREHPRARGENFASLAIACIFRGTSPRTRGKRVGIMRQILGFGNIPAHAGKTGTSQAECRTGPEHPRARGENRAAWLKLRKSYGTSPRTRGKLHRVHAGVENVRNIPAHAGKTPLTTNQRPLWGEHPRARGENPTIASREWNDHGTSPRTRGKRHPAKTHAARRGNIPAHAGKTLIDVRFLVPEGHFTFDFVFLHRGGSMESPCSSLLSECFSARIVVYGQLGTSLLSAYGCAFWWDGG